MFRHKGELLYSIPETATLADISAEKIVGYIIINQIESRTVFGTRYVTEAGLSDLLSWYGSTYHPDIAKDILNERLGMTIKDTCVTLMEMALSNTEEIGRMIRIAELKKVAAHDKLQHYNNLIPEYTHDSPVLLCSND